MVAAPMILMSRAYGWDAECEFAGRTIAVGGTASPMIRGILTAPLLFAAAMLVAAPASAVPATIPGDGVYSVGDEAAPGTYKSAGPSMADGVCVWSTYSTMVNDYDSLLDSNSSMGKLYAVISTGAAAFETMGCSTWVKVK